MRTTATSVAPTSGPIRNRITGLTWVRAGDLVPHPANWRRHPARQRAALRGLLRQIGYADALLARRDGDRLVLIDGHLRQSLDPDQVVPVLVLDLDQREAELLLATLDPLAGMATPDPGALAELLERVQASSAAVRALLEGLARGAGIPVLPLRRDPDHLPETVPPRTSRRDLWALGRHRLVCADARSGTDLDRLMEGRRADVLWTDPPYGVDYAGKTSRALRIAGDRAEGLGGPAPGILRRGRDSVCPRGGPVRVPSGGPAAGGVPAGLHGPGLAPSPDPGVGQGHHGAGPRGLPLPPRAHRLRLRPGGRPPREGGRRLAGGPPAGRGATTRTRSWRSPVPGPPPSIPP